MRLLPFLVTALFLLAAPVAAHATQVVSFAAERASAPLPDQFRVSTSGDGLAATFGELLDHTVELSLVAVIPDPDVTQAQAVAFIQAQAKKKGLCVSSKGKLAAFSEPGGQQQQDGKTLQAMHWQIGVGNCVFVLTLRAPVPMSKDLDAFLSGPLNELIHGLTCAAP